MARLYDLAATAKTIAEAARDIIELGHPRATVHLDPLGISVQIDTRYRIGRNGPEAYSTEVSIGTAAIVETWEDYPAFRAVAAIEDDDTVEGVIAGAEAAVKSVERARMIARLREVAQQERAASALHKAALARRVNAIRAAAARGVSGDTAAQALGITRQRLGQINRPTDSPQSHLVGDVAKLPHGWILDGMPPLPLDMEAALALADEQQARVDAYARWVSPTTE